MKQEVFEFFMQEHGITLTEGQYFDILHAVGYNDLQAEMDHLEDELSKCNTKLGLEERDCDDLQAEVERKDKLLARAAKGVRWLFENNDNSDAETIDLLHTLEQEEYEKLKHNG